MTPRCGDVRGTLSRLGSVLGIVALATLGGCATPETATAPVPAPVAPSSGDDDIAALEGAFWYCDYVATTRGVLAAPMAACQHATDELKARKFCGSFRAMTAWWQENKAGEHERQRRLSR
jgi:hypothetical protein